jgi:hypothetical protein
MAATNGPVSTITTRLEPIADGFTVRFFSGRQLDHAEKVFEVGEWAFWFLASAHKHVRGWPGFYRHRFAAIRRRPRDPKIALEIS